MSHPGRRCVSVEPPQSSTPRVHGVGTTLRWESVWDVGVTGDGQSWDGVRGRQWIVEVDARVRGPLPSDGRDPLPSDRRSAGPKNDESTPKPFSEVERDMARHNELKIFFSHTESIEQKK